MANLRIIYILMVIIGFSNCNSRKKIHPALKEFSWLLGKWQGNDSNIKFTEEWHQTNDSTFAGIGIFMLGNDTVSTETISLELIDGKICYIPTVSNQNEGLSVKFTLNKKTQNQWVFENNLHHFPQWIIYKKISDDSMSAEISGEEDEVPKSEIFHMKKLDY